MPEQSGNSRLIETLDDLRERMVRIEEGIKPITDIKKDVDLLKISVSEVVASSSSAHKRIDRMEKELKEDYTTKTEHEGHGERLKKLEKNQNWVATVIIGAVIMAVIGLVIIKN